MLTTLERAKKLLQIAASDTSQDDILALLLDAVSTQIEGETGRQFALDDYSETFDATGEIYLFLPQFPVTALPVVIIDGIEDTDFTPVYDCGILRKSAGWNGKAEVTYSAGYAVIPADLEYAAVQLVNIALNMQGIEHLSEEKVGPLASKFLPDTPLFIQKIIDRYKRPVMA